MAAAGRDSLDVSRQTVAEASHRGRALRPQGLESAGQEVEEAEPALGGPALV